MITQVKPAPESKAPVHTNVLAHQPMYFAWYQTFPTCRALNHEIKKLTARTTTPPPRTAITPPSMRILLFCRANETCSVFVTVASKGYVVSPLQRHVPSGLSFFGGDFLGTGSTYPKNRLLEEIYKRTQYNENYYNI